MFSIFKETVLTRLYRHREFCATRDVQVLAMLAVALLKAYASSVEQGECVLPAAIRHSTWAAVTNTPSTKEPSPTISKTESDYFSLARSKDPRAAILSPGWPRLPSTSPTTTSYVVASSLSASNSSRGSWSSLFNTGSVRQFMSGVQESISAPLDTLPVKPAVAIPQRETVLRLPNIDSPRHLRRGELTSTASPVSKSWSEIQSPLSRQSAFSSVSYGRRLLAVNQRQAIREKKLVVEEEPQQQAQRYASTLSNTILRSMTIPLLGQS